MCLALLSSLPHSDKLRVVFRAFSGAQPSSECHSIPLHRALRCAEAAFTCWLRAIGVRVGATPSDSDAGPMEHSSEDIDDHRAQAQHKEDADADLAAHADPEVRGEEVRMAAVAARVRAFVRQALVPCAAAKLTSSCYAPDAERAASTVSEQRRKSWVRLVAPDSSTLTGDPRPPPSCAWPETDRVEFATDPVVSSEAQSMAERAMLEEDAENQFNVTANADASEAQDVEGEPGCGLTAASQLAQLWALRLNQVQRLRAWPRPMRIRTGL